MTARPAAGIRWRAELGFCLLILAYIAVLAASLSPLSRDAAFFPKIVLSIAAALGLAKLASILSPTASRIIEPELHTANELEIEAARAAPEEEEEAGVTRLWVAWWWTVLTAAAMVLFGFLIATAVAVFAYVRFVARGSLISALVTAGGTVAFMYLMFERAMRIDLGLGLIGHLF